MSTGPGFGRDESRGNPTAIASSVVDYRVPGELFVKTQSSVPDSSSIPLPPPAPATARSALKEANSSTQWVLEEDEDEAL